MTVSLKTGAPWPSAGERGASEGAAVTRMLAIIMTARAFRARDGA
jgi:hypothetical protein